MKTKLYIVSGLGADFKVLERLSFPDEFEICFLDWLIPQTNETFEHYIDRFAALIDDSKPFFLLGYSFGGIIVQEINRKKPAAKTIILGSIKSQKEKSRFIKAGQISHLPKYLPLKLFNEKTFSVYAYFRKLFDPKNPKLLQYFTVRDPYYLKWSIEKISEWQGEENPEIIQILADKDIVFPLKNSKPDYIVKNATHLFPATKYKEVSLIITKILKENSLS